MPGDRRRTTTRESTAAGPVRRVEVAILLVLLLFAFVLRVWRLSSAGIDHFDEAVYAFSALGLTQAGQPHVLYPGYQHFSPPVFAGLVGLSYYAFGAPSDTAAISTNVFLGTLSVAMVWWLARSWFGASAGMAAATLAALNTFHIALSRTVLTDIAFTLFFMLALKAIVTSMHRQSVACAILAGLAVGLAWNTKYHGWFACVVAAGALVLYARCSPGVAIWRLAGVLGLTAAVAAITYLPWVVFVQSQPLGYAGLAQVHRSMMSFSVFHNLWRQVEMQMFFDGPLSRCAVPLALLAATAVGAGRAQLTTRFLLVLVGAGAATMVIGGTGTVAALAVLAIPTLLRRRDLLQTWILLGWATLWVVSLPLYRPYARLALPLVIAAALLAGVWISAVLREPSGAPGGWFSRPLVIALVAVTVAVLPGVLVKDNHPWSDSRAFARAAAAMVQVIPPGSPVVVLAEPPLAFYLHLANRPAFTRVQDPATLASVATPVYVVAGMYAESTPSLRRGLDALRDRLERVGTFTAHPGDIRLLDDFPPEQARRQRVQPDDAYQLTLYRLSPSSGGSS